MNMLFMKNTDSIATSRSFPRKPSTRAASQPIAPLRRKPANAAARASASSSPASCGSTFATELRIMPTMNTLITSLLALRLNAASIQPARAQPKPTSISRTSITIFSRTIKADIGSSLLSSSAQKRTAARGSPFSLCSLWYLRP